MRWSRQCSVMISISVYSYSSGSTTVVMEQEDGDEEGYFLLMEYWPGDSLESIFFCYKQRKNISPDILK
jgi:hypothetical protein